MALVRSIIVLCLSSLTGLNSYAQTARPAGSIYSDQFQRFVENRNIDSAFYCAEQLALDSKSGKLNDVLHDSFAQNIITSSDASLVDTAFARWLVKRLYTGSLPLKRSVYPLYQWTEAKRNLGDSAKIRQIVSGLMVVQARSEEEQGNRIDRYALLICQLLKSIPNYAVLSDTLFNRTRQRLEHGVNGLFYYAVDNNRTHQSSRAYFRYLMAYSSFKKATEAIRNHDLAAAESFLKEASQFSPDDNDRLVKSAYFNESMMLLNSEFANGFVRTYADFLLEKGDTLKAVQAVTELTLADPGNIDLLKMYYQKTPAGQLSFADYWSRALNATLKPAEEFNLASLDGKPLDYRQYKGKWVLIDFWGTWCKPCVEEMPRLQTFYRELATSRQDNVVVMTVACSDTEARVRNFVGQHQYSFPVAMADQTIEKSFRISEYPTKVLITPQGNRMKIPFGTNWAERVKIYTNN